MEIEKKITTFAETSISMKNIFLIITLCCLFNITIKADSYWKNKFALGQTEEWYGSDEAVRVAENVLIYQRNSGGWPKNIEMHEELTSQQKEEIKNQKGELSCFDNGATTTEMRFLAKVYRHIPDSRYIEAFRKGLNCIIEAQSLCGSGWPQYWPRRGGSAGALYSNFITFNDNVMTNILEMLRDVFNDNGDFADIADAETRQQAQECFDKGVQCILDCQIRKDNGELAVWCAQHDPVTLLPAVGRNYEMPSYSGGESVNILTFLMSIDNPSEEVKQAIKSGVRWFDDNALEDKAIEEFINDAGEKDKRMIDAPGQRLWGRFVQIGGETGRRTYEALFEYLEKYGDTRTYNINGKTVKYRDVDNARNSYDPNMADQPICCPKNQDAGCAYRFAYNFNDTPPVEDENGVMLPTSLSTYDRTTYTFIDKWGQRLTGIYNAWLEKNGDVNWTTYALNKDETITSGTTIELKNISLTYGEAGGPDFLITIEDPYSEVFKYYTPGNNVNGNKEGGTFYVFTPEKDGEVTTCVKHNQTKPLYVDKDGIALPDYNGVTFDESHPSKYTLSFTVKAGSSYKLYCRGSKLGFYGFTFKWDDESNGIHQTAADKYEDNRIFNLRGQLLSCPKKGINIIGGKKVVIQ